MKNVYFYFDPCCPWCWVTSRWLDEVSRTRDFSVTWQPFSLALKNDEVVENDGEQSAYGAYHRSGHRVLRLIEAIVDKHGETERFKLYSALGAEYHVRGDEEFFTDEMIKKALVSCGYSDEFMSSLDDIAYDRDLQKCLDEATAVVGDDIGVPTIIFEQEDGTKTGYFGPVITELPSKEDGLKLWDGLSTLAGVKGFYELKRSRTVDVNTASTQRTLE